MSSRITGQKQAQKNQSSIIKNLQSPQQSKLLNESRKFTPSNKEFQLNKILLDKEIRIRTDESFNEPSGDNDQIAGSLLVSQYQSIQQPDQSGVMAQSTPSKFDFHKLRQSQTTKHSQ